MEDNEKLLLCYIESTSKREIKGSMRYLGHSGLFSSTTSNKFLIHVGHISQSCCSSSVRLNLQ